MSFQFVPNELAAVDEALGLRIEADMTFYDETTTRIELMDKVAGGAWSMPVREVRADISYDTPNGPMTSRLATSASLPRAQIEDALRQIVIGRRTLERPLDPADLRAAVEDGLLVFLTNGRELLKFVPQFHVTWD